MNAPVPMQIDVKQNDPTVVQVTNPEGKKYELKMALMVTAVLDQGQINPLDGQPIFHVVAQIVTQTKPWANDRTAPV